MDIEELGILQVRWSAIHIDSGWRWYVAFNAMHTCSTVYISSASMHRKVNPKWHHRSAMLESFTITLKCQQDAHVQPSIENMSNFILLTVHVVFSLCIIWPVLLPRIRILLISTFYPMFSSLTVRVTELDCILHKRPHLVAKKGVTKVQLTYQNICIKSVHY